MVADQWENVMNIKAEPNWHFKMFCKQSGVVCYLITIFYKVSVWFWAYALAYEEINVRSSDIIHPAMGKNLHISSFKLKWQNLIGLESIYQKIWKNDYHDQMIKMTFTCDALKFVILFLVFLAIHNNSGIFSKV